MQLLRGILIVQIVAIYGYTAVVMGRDGIDFFTPFLTSIFAVNWSGQFNLDFMSYLILSALWVAWRHRFSTGGLVMAGLSGVLGFVVFAPYLLVQSLKVQSVKALVLGAHAED